MFAAAILFSIFLRPPFYAPVYMDDVRQYDPCVIGWECLAYSIDVNAHSGQHYNCDDCRFCEPGNPPIPLTKTIVCFVSKDAVDNRLTIYFENGQIPDVNNVIIFSVKPINECNPYSYCNEWDVNWIPEIPYWFCIPVDYFNWCG